MHLCLQVQSNLNSDSALLAKHHRYFFYPVLKLSRGLLPFRQESSHTGHLGLPEKKIKYFSIYTYSSTSTFCTIN